MKIVHTSDWHAGRIWKGEDRLDELTACLDHLASFIERESTDLLLVTGDVFDSGQPAARAEKAVFHFFKRIGATGAQTVVIAGNHDSPDRFEAWGALTELVNVHAIGRPKPAKEGGVIEIVSKSGENAIVAGVPFASQRRLVTALQLAEGEDSAMKTYADKMRQIVEHLSGSFRPDAVNLLCLHTHVEGAIKGSSERQVHLGDDWAALPSTFPTNAHYIALGHIHRPQKINAPSPAYYAGSPLQMDFGEAGEQKTFLVIEAAAGPRPAQISAVPYVGALPLKSVRGELKDLVDQAADLQNAGWLRVTVDLDDYDADINRRVRELLPKAVSVDAVIKKAASPIATMTETGSPSDAFRQYYRETYGEDASDALITAFSELRDAVEADQCAQ